MFSHKMFPTGLLGYDAVSVGDFFCHILFWNTRDYKLGNTASHHKRPESLETLCDDLKHHMFISVRTNNTKYRIWEIYLFWDLPKFLSSSNLQDVLGKSIIYLCLNNHPTGTPPIRKYKMGQTDAHGYCIHYSSGITSADCYIYWTCFYAFLLRSWMWE